jgi:hypothetical protein
MNLFVKMKYLQLLFQPEWFNKYTYIHTYIHTYIKSIMNEIAPILVHLVNQMMKTGSFPEAFKTAVVTPINKSGRLTDVSDCKTRVCAVNI